MYQHRFNTRVRYSETDQMKYVYYGNYAMFYEIGRVELMRSLGTTYRELEESGIMMPVYEMHCRYHKPAMYDDDITIETTVNELQPFRIRFDHRILRDEVVLNEGYVTLVFVDMMTNKISKMPSILNEKLGPFFTNQK